MTIPKKNWTTGSAPRRESGRPCKVCGADTTTPHADLCNGCWEIGYQAEALIRRNREAAKILFAALTEKLDAGDELDEWLIQDTRQIVGNCILWWGPDGSGYTTELKEAGRFTEAFAKGQRESDRAIPLPIAKKFASTHVRGDTGIRSALSKGSDQT